MVYILELKTTQATAIKIVIDAINSLLTDANFDFYPYHIESDNSSESDDNSNYESDSDNQSSDNESNIIVKKKANKSSTNLAGRCYRVKSA